MLDLLVRKLTYIKHYLIIKHLLGTTEKCHSEFDPWPAYIKVQLRLKLAHSEFGRKPWAPCLEANLPV